MEPKRILVVDDEKNIRLTLTQALESDEWQTDTAVNGEEALQKLQESEFDLMLLDLKMPGIDGMEVLRHVAEDRPDVRVVIITAYGTIESAVEAMKLGAVDYLQKPFVPTDIRELVSRVIARGELKEEQASDYESRLELVKKCINERHFDAAEVHARKAINIDLERPEAHNLLGALFEMRGMRREAHQQYLIAYHRDPSYKPASENLERITRFSPGFAKEGIALWESKEKQEESQDTSSEDEDSPPEEKE